MPEKAPTFSEVMFLLFLLAGWSCLSLYAICSFFLVNVHSPFGDWEISMLKSGIMFLSAAFLAYSISGENRPVCAIRLLVSLLLGTLTFLLDPFFLIISAFLLMTAGFAI